MDRPMRLQRIFLTHSQIVNQVNIVHELAYYAVHAAVSLNL